MDMLIGLAIVGVVLLLLNVALTVTMLVVVVGRRPAEEVRAVHPANQPEDVARENKIDEGFENIMRFEVGGKTGFEQEGLQWR